MRSKPPSQVGWALPTRCLIVNTRTRTDESEGLLVYLPFGVKLLGSHCQLAVAVEFDEFALSFG